MNETEVNGRERLLKQTGAGRVRKHNSVPAGRAKHESPTDRWRRTAALTFTHTYTPITEGI